MSRNIEVALYRLAHARSGDKGDRLNIALICYDPAFYATIAEQATAERVAAHFVARRPSKVVRYELPKLCAFNYVLDDVLEGGVNASLGLDGHGKSLSFFLLTMKIRVNPALLIKAVVGKLNAALNAALTDKAVRDALLAAGIEPVTSSPEELRAYVAAETRKWADIVRAAGIQPE